MSDQNQYAVVDVSDNDTTVLATPAVLVGLLVTVALSAHSCPFKDGGTSGTTVAVIPASAGIGTWIECGDIELTSDLTADPNDSGTGTVTAVYKDLVLASKSLSI